MADFRVTPAALRDLEEIWLYTRRKWNAGQADRYIDDLFKAFPGWQVLPDWLQLVITSVPAIAAIAWGSI